MTRSPADVSTSPRPLVVVPVVSPSLSGRRRVVVADWCAVWRTKELGLSGYRATSPLTSQELQVRATKGATAASCTFIWIRWSESLVTSYCMFQLSTWNVLRIIKVAWEFVLMDICIRKKRQKRIEYDGSVLREVHLTALSNNNKPTSTLNCFNCFMYKYYSFSSNFLC